MKTSTCKIMLYIVTVSALLTVPFPTQRAHADASGFTYFTNSDACSVTITGYSGPDGVVAIPDTIDAKSVTALGSDLFTQVNVTSVSIPKTVLSIDSGTFWECRSLQSIQVDADNPNYTSADGIVFNNGGSVLIHYPAAKPGNTYVLPDTVTSVGDCAFDHNQNLQSILLTQKVTRIGNCAFWRCEQLTAFTIPKSVDSIGDSPFANCSRITRITVENGNTTYKDMDGVLFSIDGTMLIQCPAGKAGSYAVLQGVTTLNSGSFRGCTLLTSVQTGHDVTDIKDCAFTYCDSLKTVELGESVQTIGYAAFQGCTSLKSILFPASVTDIASCAFDGCSALHEAYFIGNAPQMGETVFSGCADGLLVYHMSASTGFSNPWNGCPVAAFDPNSIYTVAFNMNEAPGTPPQTQRVYKGVRATLPERPSFEGKVFGGWFLDSACSLAWDFNMPVVADLTLYASWTGSFYVSILADDGGFAQGSGMYAYKSQATLSATPSAGCRFTGWREGSKNGKLVSTDPMLSFRVSENRTLYAGFAAIGTPSVLVASAGYTSLKISWNAVDGVFGYEVWRSTSLSGTYSKIGSASGTSFSDIGLCTNAAYYYKVGAYCVSTTATTYGSLSAPTCAVPVPGAPESVHAAATRYDCIALSWSKVDGANGYQIFRSYKQDGSYALFKTISALSLADKSLKTGTAYYYKIRAYRTIGKAKVYGDYSAIAYTTPLLSCVSSASASAYSPTGVKISWSSVPGRSGYEIWQSTSPDKGFALYKSTSGTTLKESGLVPFQNILLQGACLQDGKPYKSVW